MATKKTLIIEGSSDATILMPTFPKNSPKEGLRKFLNQRIYSKKPPKEPKKGNTTRSNTL